MRKQREVLGPWPVIGLLLGMALASDWNPPRPEPVPKPQVSAAPQVQEGWRSCISRER